jgi:hypothetical protein
MSLITEKLEKIDVIVIRDDNNELTVVPIKDTPIFKKLFKNVKENKWGFFINMNSIGDGDIVDLTEWFLILFKPKNGFDYNYEKKYWKSTLVNKFYNYMIKHQCKSTTSYKVDTEKYNVKLIIEVNDEDNFLDQEITDEIFEEIEDMDIEECNKIEN